MFSSLFFYLWLINRKIAGKVCIKLTLTQGFDSYCGTKKKGGGVYSIIGEKGANKPPSNSQYLVSKALRFSTNHDVY